MRNVFCATLFIFLPVLLFGQFFMLPNDGLDLDRTKINPGFSALSQGVTVTAETFVARRYHTTHSWNVGINAYSSLKNPRHSIGGSFMVNDRWLMKEYSPSVFYTYALPLGNSFLAGGATLDFDYTIPDEMFSSYYRSIFSLDFHLLFHHPYFFLGLLSEQFPSKELGPDEFQDGYRFINMEFSIGGDIPIKDKIQLQPTFILKNNYSTQAGGGYFSKFEFSLLSTWYDWLHLGAGISQEEPVLKAMAGFNAGDFTFYYTYGGAFVDYDYFSEHNHWLRLAYNLPAKIQ